MEEPFEQQDHLDSTYDKLIYYWSKQFRDLIDTQDISVRSLAYHPLRVIAGEWSNYIELLGFGLKQDEITRLSAETARDRFDQINATLSYLASCSRRVLSSKAHLRDALDFIHPETDAGPPTEDWEGLLEDYRHLCLKLSDYGKLLETNTALLMSNVQLAESRQAFSEARNMGRLTVLTLLFVPLNFVSSLFSMNDIVSPGARLFWLYFAVAVPFLLVVVFVMGSITRFSWLVRGAFRRAPRNSLPV